MSSRPRALDRLERKLTVENLWIYIIKILMDEGRPLRAYDLKVRLKERFGINPPAITVYTVIYRMARDGLVQRKKEGEETYYVPTELGIESYKKALLFIETILSKLKI